MNMSFVGKTAEKKKQLFVGKFPSKKDYKVGAHISSYLPLCESQSVQKSLIIAFFVFVPSTPQRTFDKRLRKKKYQNNIF